MMRLTTLWLFSASYLTFWAVTVVVFTLKLSAGPNFSWLHAQGMCSCPLNKTPFKVCLTWSLHCILPQLRQCVNGVLAKLYIPVPPPATCSITTTSHQWRQNYSHATTPITSTGWSIIRWLAEFSKAQSSDSSQAVLLAVMMQYTGEEFDLTLTDERFQWAFPAKLSGCPSMPPGQQFRATTCCHRVPGWLPTDLSGYQALFSEDFWITDYLHLMQVSQFLFLFSSR